MYLEIMDMDNFFSFVFCVSAKHAYYLFSFSII